MKHVRLLCSLCTVACIAFPLASLLNGSFEYQDVIDIFDQDAESENVYDEIYNNTLNEYQISNAENLLKQEIIQSIGADSAAFDVKIITEKNNDEICISLVRVTVYTSGLSINPREVEKYVTQRLGCECETVYDIL